MFGGSRCFQLFIYIVLCALSHSCVRIFATPWTIACQAPLSVGILQARILDLLPFPPSGDLPNPGVKARSPVLQADSLPSESPGKPTFTYIYTIWSMFLLSHSVSAMEGIESYAYLDNYYLSGVEKKTIVG